jgi:hypothetical protein
MNYSSAGTVAQHSLARRPARRVEQIVLLLHGTTVAGNGMLVDCAPYTVMSGRRSRAEATVLRNMFRNRTNVGTTFMQARFVNDPKG